MEDEIEQQLEEQQGREVEAAEMTLPKKQALLRLAWILSLSSPSILAYDF